jgi:hypothetical protein
VKRSLRIPLALTYTLAATACLATLASCDDDDPPPSCETFCIPDDNDPANPCRVGPTEETLCADMFENNECPARCRPVG